MVHASGLVPNIYSTELVIQSQGCQLSVEIDFKPFGQILRTFMIPGGPVEKNDVPVSTFLQVFLRLFFLPLQETVIFPP